MRYSFAALGMIIIGMLGVVVLIVFQDVMVNNEADYYSIKEAMEASMIESIDKSYYARYGELKIVEQKFVENFTRRFANGTMGDTQGYAINFYDIMESPPKASVVINNSTEMLVLDLNDRNVQNYLTGILEATHDYNTYDEKACKGTIKTASVTINDYYGYVYKGGNHSYSLNEEKALSSISLNRDAVLSLRVSEVEVTELVNGSGSVNSSLYVGSVSFGAGVEENGCYTATAKVSIENATGEGNDGHPIVKVSAIDDADGINRSDCSGTSNSLIKYRVVWSYDYCYVQNS